MDWKKYSWANITKSALLPQNKRSSSKKRSQKLKEHPERVLHVTFEYYMGRNHSEMLRTIAFNPIFEASVLTVAKRKSDMPIRAEDPTMA